MLATVNKINVNSRKKHMPHSNTRAPNTGASTRKTRIAHPSRVFQRANIARAACRSPCARRRTARSCSRSACCSRCSCSPRPRAPRGSRAGRARRARQGRSCARDGEVKRGRRMLSSLAHAAACAQAEAGARAGEVKRGRRMLSSLALEPRARGLRHCFYMAYTLGRSE